MAGDRCLPRESLSQKAGKLSQKAGEFCAHQGFVKGGLVDLSALTLCVLRTFHPARGGEVYGVLPGRGPGHGVVLSRTPGLARRAIPFVAIAALLSIALGTGAASLLVFPLFVIVALPVALFDDEAQLIAVGVAAAAATAIGKGAPPGPLSHPARAVVQVAGPPLRPRVVRPVVRRCPQR